MSSGTAPIYVPLEPSGGSSTAATSGLLAAMLGAHAQVSDLIFSPGRPPQVQSQGRLIAMVGRPLTADDTRHIASDLIGANKQAITMLREHGSCDVSHGLPGLARFRVNIFIQRGSCAIVMRVIPTVVPTLTSLALPARLQEAARLRDGIVLVTGPRNSGKSSTLAALLDCINEERVCHIITIEDPIEFLHNHKRATVHQRELHSDTPSFPLGLRAAMRQAPDVILVSELRERDTVEMAIDTAESGHLVFSSLNAPDAGKALERMVGFFAATEQPGVRARLAKTVRWIISQRLLPRKDGAGRTAVAQIVIVDSQLRKHFEGGDFSSEKLLEAAKRGPAQGCEGLDREIAKLVSAGVVDLDTGVMHASDPDQLSRALSDLAAQ
ncbi:MAG TPA: PilT/PilU family type 4a pilus ATPase [Terriglobales bacterium]|nr:PilT/PilU family type 4a pilus ATPase [Terriglobales bacterium]